MDARLTPGTTVRVKDSNFKCPNKRSKIVGRTGFDERHLQDGRIQVIAVHDDGQIHVAHPDAIGSMQRPTKIHSKFFEPATPAEVHPS
ncbi:MAG: hypothetical protein K9L31_02900 [Candidatus Pacebacteria bacterium]|nr:hypothetical protein [Candidatus Paceibacterota bacterium]